MTCNSDHEGLPELRRHLTAVHAITSLTGAKKHTKSVSEGKYFWSIDNEWEIDGLKVTQSVFRHRKRK